MEMAPCPVENSPGLLDARALRVPDVVEPIDELAFADALALVQLEVPRKDPR